MTSDTPADPAEGRGDSPAPPDPVDDDQAATWAAGTAELPAGRPGQQLETPAAPGGRESLAPGEDAATVRLAAAAGTSAAGRHSRLPLWTVVAGALLAFALDQASKAWALAELGPNTYKPLIGDLFGLQLVFNPGAAFSFAEGMTWIFTIIAVVVVVVIVRVARRLRSRAWALVLAALLGGTLGNLFDRLFRDPGFGRGYVVDFLDYNSYFVGNVADIFIVAAAIGMGVLTFIGTSFSGERAGNPGGLGAEEVDPEDDAASAGTGDAYDPRIATPSEPVDPDPLDPTYSALVTAADTADTADTDDAATADARADGAEDADDPPGQSRG